MMVYTYEGDAAEVTFVWRPGLLASGRATARRWFEANEAQPSALSPGEFERYGMTSKVIKGVSPKILVKPEPGTSGRGITRLKKAVFTPLHRRMKRKFINCELVWLT